MWSRSALKEKAKERRKVNYWKMVLVALILTVVTGSNLTFNLGGTNSASSGADSSLEESYSYAVPYGDNDVTFGSTFQIPGGASSVMRGLAFAPFLFAGVFLVFLLVLAIAIPLSAFVLNPVAVGCNRFFYRNIRQKAEVKEIGFSFDNHYMNCVKIMFFRDLYTFLWSLLFVIPGIVKAYEYRMIPYILGEHPEMDKEQAFAMSREMMDGNKLDAFLLDLSFIGWHLLSALTGGILGIFYVDQYVSQTNAMLYDAIKYEKYPEEMRQWTQPGEDNMNPGMDV